MRRTHKNRTRRTLKGRRRRTYKYVPQILKRSKHQTGKTNVEVDKKVLSMPPGVRMSSSGRKYAEYRANRSDKNKKKRL